MNIYDLNEAHYLYEDIQEVIDRILSMYTIEENDGKRFYRSRLNVPGKHPWLTKEGEEAFNNLIPKIKSLHKDMYGLIEAICKHKNNDSFDRIALANAYSNFDNFRHLNNQFKHFTGGSVNITLTALSVLEGNTINIDVYCNFKKSDGTFDAIRYPEFIDTFIIFLKDNQLISF